MDEIKPSQHHQIIHFFYKWERIPPLGLISDKHESIFWAVMLSWASIKHFLKKISEAPNERKHIIFHLIGD